MIDYIIKINRRTKSILTDGWVWKMAWRDARHNISRLFLFTASLVTGIAAVVALDSISYALQTEIDNNAKELLGADLVVEGRKEFVPEVQAAFDSIKYPQASEANMATMVLFLNSNQSRLIRLVALEGEFPFYGEFETIPEGSYDKVFEGRYAVLDETLASQYGVSTDDSIRIGTLAFTVAGVVRNLPGGGGILSTFTPSVYISMNELDSTGLVDFGTRANYKRYFKLESEQAAEETGSALRPLLRKYGYSSDTVGERREELGEGFLSVYRFFSLLAFVALILGCIGVASSVHIYAREKREEVAVLRCLGSSGWQAFNIFFIQIFLLGVIGSFLGTLVGFVVQQAIPYLLEGVVPFEVTAVVSWKSLVMGLLLGAVVSVLFSILPLASVRFVPPLTVLRTDFQPRKEMSRTQITTFAAIGLFPIAFAWLQTRNLFIAVMFFLGLVVALACLAAVAMFLLFMVRRFFPERAGFIWRHALSGLFRPNNQTRVLMITIGLGAFIISTLNIVEQSMLSQVEFTGRENQSNTILFDIQPSQVDGVLALMKDNGLEAKQVVPIITCSLIEVKGKSVDSLQRDTTDNIPNWALTREYRVTYRDSLHHSEELIDGQIQYMRHGQDSVWVTISEGLVENLGVTVGDSLVFDIQGLPMKVFIAGIRKVEWSKDPPNFFFVFPPGVLENAPQIYVTSLRIDDTQVANRFQQQLVMGFPNVSLIDLRLILSTINALFDKLGLIIRFLAMFSIVTGLVVLAGAVINSKFVRIKEHVLLRTIGARTKQITSITLIEYAYLGLFSALTGLILSMGSGYLLSAFFFDISFAFNWIELILICTGVILLTMTIGWFNSREVIYTPPLQVLRKET